MSFRPLPHGPPALADTVGCPHNTLNCGTPGTSLTDAKACGLIFID